MSSKFKRHSDSDSAKFAFDEPGLDYLAPLLEIVQEGEQVTESTNIPSISLVKNEVRSFRLQEKPFLQSPKFYTRALSYQKTMRKDHSFRTNVLLLAFSICQD